MSSVLGATVTSFESVFLDSGVASDAFRIHGITYDPASAEAPTSVVIKLSSRVPELRAFSMMGNAYDKELKFYQSLAGDVPLNVPKIYASFSDGSDGSEFFIIVMEDLAAHSIVFDLADDPPDEAWARSITSAAAALHAKFWESETTRLPWLAREDGRCVFPLHALSAMAQTTWPMFRSLWVAHYGADVFADDEWKPVAQLTDLLCSPDGPAIHEAIYDILASRPRTLIHGDMRGDNVFRRVGSMSADDNVLTFIDWQMVQAGPPGPEFTQAWQHTLAPDVRRMEKEMLKDYRDTLVALNPDAASYTYDMLLEDYILGYCFWWTALIALGVGRMPAFDKPGSERMKEAFGIATFRVKTALRDLDCLSHVLRLAGRLSRA